jgi:TolA-binding protein
MNTSLSYLGEAMMKKGLVTVSGMTLLMTGAACAEVETPMIDQRQTNQEQRIDQGVTSGRLNEREMNRLNMQQEQVNKMENRAKSDAIMTDKGRARIAAAQDRAARHIAREKHDRQGKRRR